MRATTNDFGPGRLVAVNDDGMATVRYFDSMADGGQLDFSIPCDQLELSDDLAAVSRVLPRPRLGIGGAGRVIRSSGDQEFFEIRTGSVYQVVEARDLFPRWQRPLENPFASALAMGFESPFFAASPDPLPSNTCFCSAPPQGACQRSPPRRLNITHTSCESLVAFFKTQSNGIYSRMK